MPVTRRPLIGASWTDAQVAMFEEWRYRTLPFSERYLAQEAQLAFWSWRVLAAMLSGAQPVTEPGEEECPLEPPAPHDVPEMQKMKSMALDIVCRRLGPVSP